MTTRERACEWLNNCGLFENGMDCLTAEMIDDYLTEDNLSDIAAIPDDAVLPEDYSLEELRDLAREMVVADRLDGVDVGSFFRDEAGDLYMVVPNNRAIMIQYATAFKFPFAAFEFVTPVSTEDVESALKEASNDS